MTAWDIRKHVLACDHFDKHRATLDKPEGIRCSSRFEIKNDPWGKSRSVVRRAARKLGWVHVHEPGSARQRDKDYCPLHVSDAAPPIPEGFDPATGRSSQDDWSHEAH